MAGAALARVSVPIASRREASKRASHKRMVERGAYRVARAIVANCDYVRSQLIEEGVPQEKVVTIHNGLDSDRFAPRANLNRAEALARLSVSAEPSSRFVGIVANLRPVKDHQTFLKAMQLVSRAVPESAFLLAGEGNLLADLKELAVQLGIAERTFFLGACRTTEEVLALSEVCVLSSVSEGFSNSILEYMAAGRPVVATDVGGVREVVTEGETGYLLTPGDCQTLADRVIYLLKNPKEAQLMGEKARNVVSREFSTTRQLERVEELYERLG
jgi:glycosyltransferase involved in cell wall biosynthesis